MHQRCLHLGLLLQVCVCCLHLPDAVCLCAQKSSQTLPFLPASIHPSHFLPYFSGPSFLLNPPGLLHHPSSLLYQCLSKPMPRDTPTSPLAFQSGKFNVFFFKFFLLQLTYNFLSISAVGSLMFDENIFFMVEKQVCEESILDVQGQKIEIKHQRGST